MIELSEHIQRNKNQQTVAILTPEQRHILNECSRIIQAAILQHKKQMIEFEEMLNDKKLNLELYLSALEASKRFINSDSTIGCSVRKMQEWCQLGKIEGAIRKGSRWMVPKNCSLLKQDD